VFCCLQQVNDSHHWAGGSWRWRTVATAARHPRSSRRWASCLGKIAEVVSRCLPRGFYFHVSFSWIAGCSSIIDTNMQGSCQRQLRCHRAVMVLQEPGSLLCLRTRASYRERPTDDVIAAFMAETNMLPPCRHEDPGTYAMRGLPYPPSSREHPPCGVDQPVLACSRETALLQLPGAPLGGSRLVFCVRGCTIREGVTPC